MRYTDSPWKWPLCTGTGLLAVAGLMALFAFFWDRSLGPAPFEAETRPTQPESWLVLLPPHVPPPPEVSVGPPPTSPPPPRRDPDWWTSNWTRMVTERAEEALAAAPVDSVRQVLRALGLGEDILTRSRPDSVVAARLLLMRREESLRFDELKPYLRAMTRAHAYADLMSRVADMYGDFLDYRIRTPD